jgi:uncharacterized protein YnzC (UPF0291/DUF896 family)
MDMKSENGLLTAFHIEQYKALREEILQDIREIYRTEVVSVVAVVVAGGKVIPFA